MCLLNICMPFQALREQLGRLQSCSPVGIDFIWELVHFLFSRFITRAGWTDAPVKSKAKGAILGHGFMLYVWRQHLVKRACVGASGPLCRKWPQCVAQNSTEVSMR